MARLARAVVPSVPHHVTQRGNRRQQTFFSNDDYRMYVELMATWCARLGVEVWAYCLMPNHVHLIAVPDTEDGLRLAIGEAHRRYSRHVNDREGWRGHLWQGRFASFPMDDVHVLMAARYIELNPVRGRLVRKPHRWKWSSAGAHLNGRDDALATTAPLLGRVDNWQTFLAGGLSEDEMDTLHRHERTGRPLGSHDFIERLEALLGRPLRPGKPGPKPRARR